MRFKLRTIFLGVTLIACGLIGIRLLADYLDPFAGKPFNQAIWQAQAGKFEADNPRAAMFSDLKNNWLTHGMSEAEVIDLLGEPDLSREPQHFQYNLGAWSGFRIDYDVLHLHFDVSGTLISAEHLQH